MLRWPLPPLCQSPGCSCCQYWRCYQRQGHMLLPPSCLRSSTDAFHWQNVSRSQLTEGTRTCDSLTQSLKHSRNGAESHRTERRLAELLWTLLCSVNSPSSFPSGRTFPPCQMFFPILLRDLAFSCLWEFSVQMSLLPRISVIPNMD